MAGLSNTHFISMRAVGQLAPRIHINQSQILNLLIKPRHFFFPLQYISRSQYVCYSCEQGWEGDRGRGNKGLMSLAKRGWRLRQMAWSLQHSGVARLVLKSCSLTFQQIYQEAGESVTPLQGSTRPPPQKKKKFLPLLWPFCIAFLLLYPHICIHSHTDTYEGGSFGLVQAW